MYTWAAAPGESPPCSLPDPFCLSQPVEINSPTGRSSKNKGGAHWTVMDMGQKVKASAAAALGQIEANRLHAPVRPSPSLCPVPVHKFNYSKSSPNVAASKKPLAQVDPLPHPQPFSIILPALSLVVPLAVLENIKASTRSPFNRVASLFSDISDNS